LSPGDPARAAGRSSARGSPGSAAAWRLPRAAGAAASAGRPGPATRAALSRGGPGAAPEVRPGRGDEEHSDKDGRGAPGAVRRCRREDHERDDRSPRQAVTTDVQQRLEVLRREVRRHEHLYYVLDQPEISDAQFDALYRELQQLEAEHPDLVTADSPTQRVGGEPGAQFAKVRHRSPMLSLQNAFEEEEIRAWDRRGPAAVGDDLTYARVREIDRLALRLTHHAGEGAAGPRRPDRSR